MSIFGSIMTKIFHHADAATPNATPDAAPMQSAVTPDAPAPAPATSGFDDVATPAPANVDVGAVLAQLAASKGGGGNYQVSIVDLLKLLDLDSSLAARHELAQEIDVHAGADGTAEQNIALHKAVMQKLAENGGHVPDSMKG